MEWSKAHNKGDVRWVIPRESNTTKTVIVKTTSIPENNTKKTLVEQTIIPESNKNK